MGRRGVTSRSRMIMWRLIGAKYAPGTWERFSQLMTGNRALRYLVENNLNDRPLWCLYFYLVIISIKLTTKIFGGGWRLLSALTARCWVIFSRNVSSDNFWLGSGFLCWISRPVSKQQSGKTPEPRLLSHPLLLPSTEMIIFDVFLKSFILNTDPEKWSCI